MLILETKFDLSNRRIFSILKHQKSKEIYVYSKVRSIACHERAHYSAERLQAASTRLKVFLQENS